jgi:N-methylhydantoinase A
LKFQAPSLRRSCATIPVPMRIAIDTGGTFTDCVFVRKGRLEILKLPSTPRNPADAIAIALKKIFAEENASDSAALELLCGTTVGTNALLERRGGRVALVTTAGFEDVLEIGRQARPRLYDLLVKKAEPLVPQSRRFGLAERLDSEGRVLLSPGRREIARIVLAVARSAAERGAGSAWSPPEESAGSTFTLNASSEAWSPPESVAVCLLFSFVNPVHEKAIARALSAAGFQVSVSHEILPEYREYERTSTTVVNAYLVPVMSRYLGEIERHAMAWTWQSRTSSSRPNPARVRVMQSNGGVLSAQAAAREPVRTILSGPAGGVLGARYVAGLAGFDRIITFDMGGTSTDVALMDTQSGGSLGSTSETIVSEVPVAVPMLDIHTVGAGGGSIARFDRAGALRVGPESAGADPGPICYGRGEKPTVTDANLLLGRIPQAGLLGGAFELDLARTTHFMQRARGAIRSVEEFAQGILDVANSVMEKAIRVISVERGHDPRDYTLVAFGGAGALHACDLAAALEIPRVLVPCFPGALSALGILRADVTKDFSRTIRLEVLSSAEFRGKLEQKFAALERKGRKQMRVEGFSHGSVSIDRTLDVRYAGQSYELTVPFAGDYVAAFHRAHEQRYGYSDRNRSCEVVNVRARFTGKVAKPDLPKLKARQSNAADAEVKPENTVAIFSGRKFPTRIYERSKLQAGDRISGPTIVTEYSATTVIPPSWAGRVDPYGNIILEPRR